ncbi:hypothetical protein HHK36_016637 [Tetracentron sinense]|uniref:Uncharacterized protein n=1 Tax=Tetracentron sinense TaxID=13715 RepID=A0A834YZW0_TETSI|nr:hypothetical protein HHK36_016637 [Tetracentron sinense]
MLPGRPGSPTPPNNGCKQSGTITCKGKTYSTYTCSPPVIGSTRAHLTNNDFSEGGDGGGPSKCDYSYHANTERIVALSTGWYNNNRRCGKMIGITTRNGKSVIAKVVDECDLMHGCDKEHEGQPPCHNNIVDGSNAVWSGLGLDKNVGVVDITWITAGNGKSVIAKVVDECDSMHGCDKEHACQPPCRNSIVDGSDAVWSALGLDKNVGVVDNTWSMAYGLANY